MAPFAFPPDSLLNLRSNQWTSFVLWPVSVATSGAVWSPFPEAVAMELTRDEVSQGRAVAEFTVRNDGLWDVPFAATGTESWLSALPGELLVCSCPDQLASQLAKPRLLSGSVCLERSSCALLRSAS